MEVLAENVFLRNRYRLDHEILAIIVDNSSKTHRIRSKQVSFDSIFNVTFNSTSRPQKHISLFDK